MNHSKFIKLLCGKEQRDSSIGHSKSQLSLVSRSKFPNISKQDKTTFRLNLDESADIKNTLDESTHALNLKVANHSTIGSKNLRYILNEFDAVATNSKRKMWRTSSLNGLQTGFKSETKEINMLHEVKKRFFNHTRLGTQELLYMDNFKDYINKVTNKKQISGYNSSIEILPVNGDSEIDVFSNKITLFKIVNKISSTALLIISWLIRAFGEL